MTRDPMHNPRPVRVSVLGPLRVEGADGAISIPDRGRPAVAYLAMHAGRDLTVSQIAAATGGSTRTTKAAIVEAAELLPRGTLALAVAAGQPSAGLELATGSLDADRFRAATTQARALWRSANFARAATTCTAAQELWRGNPYPELADCLDALPEIHRLSEVFADLAEVRMELAIRGAAPDFGTIADLKALVADFPARRTFRLQLARALHLAGRHVEGLQTLRESIVELGDSSSTRMVAALMSDRSPDVSTVDVIGVA